MQVSSCSSLSSVLSHTEDVTSGSWITLSSAPVRSSVHSETEFDNICHQYQRIRRGPHLHLLILQRLTRSSEFQPHSVASTEKPPEVGGAAAKATVHLANLQPISFEKTMLKSEQLNRGFSRAHSIYHGLQSKHNNQITIQVSL